MVSVSYQKSSHVTCLSQADQIFNIFPRNLLRQLHNFCQNCWYFVHIKKYNISYFYAQWNQSIAQSDMLKEGGIIQTLRRWFKKCSVCHTHCWKKSQACSHLRPLSKLNHTSLSWEGINWPGYYLTRTRWIHWKLASALTQHRKKRGVRVSRICCRNRGNYIDTDNKLTRQEACYVVYMMLFLLSRDFTVTLGSSSSLMILRSNP